MERRKFTNQDRRLSLMNNPTRQWSCAELKNTADARPPFVRPAGRPNMNNKSYAGVLSNSLRTSTPLVQRSGAVTSINDPQAFSHEVVNAREPAWNSTHLKTMSNNNQANRVPFMTEKQQNRVPGNIRPSTSETIQTTLPYDRQTSPPSSEWLTAGRSRRKNRITHEVSDTEPTTSHAPTMKKPSANKPHPLASNQSAKPRLKNSRNRSKKKSLSAASSRNSSAASERHSLMPLMWSISDLLYPCDKNSGQEKLRPLKPINENRAEKIGKVREVPKVKRPTRLKRTILTERSAKKHDRCSSAPGSLRSGDSVAPTVSQNDTRESESVLVKEELGVAVATETATTRSTGGSHMVCAQLPLLPVNKVQDELVSQLITQLSQFQDRAYVKYANTPYHRKRTRRLVCGLREVVKHLRLHNLRMIFLARDLERGASHYCTVLQVASNSPEQMMPTPAKEVEGAAAGPVLEDVIKTIWDLATSPGDGQALTPILMTQNRRMLGKLCHKPGRVSIVGILSVSGGDEVAQRLLGLNSAINIPQRAPAGCPPVAQVIGGSGGEFRG